MNTRTEHRTASRSWLISCALGAVSFLATLVVLRGGAVTDPVRLMPWQSAAIGAPTQSVQSPQAASPVGYSPESWQEDCAGECGAPEPVTMSPEEAIELRAEEDVLFAALQQEAALE